MKKRGLFSILVLILSIFYVLPGKSQGTATLKVTALADFPDLPADTAYEGVSYIFNIMLKNNTNDSISSQVSINLQVDSIILPIASTSPTFILHSGDSVIIPVTQYNFTQPQYKMGNNIVVVWPVVNGLVVPIDSFITDVYFVPLNSLVNNELTDPAFQIYPIPASDFLEMEMENYNQVEYVRIFSPTGQLVKEFQTENRQRIDISFLRNGMYICEVKMDGMIVRRKFIKK